MSKQLPFFTTRDDLLTILTAVQGGMALRFTPMGTAERESPDGFTSAEQLPQLGRASADTSAAGHAYLVASADFRITARLHPASGKYFVDQSHNSATVVLRPGGFWEERILLSGGVGTSTADPRSHLLMKLFTEAFSALTRKVKSYHVGPEAAAFSAQGGRLTFAVSAAPEYDLKA